MSNYSPKNFFHDLEAGFNLAAGAAAAIVGFVATADATAATFALQLGKLRADAALAKKTGPAAK